MKKLLLLRTAFLLSSASVYAACNPNLPACQCSYPEMKNGIISCSESYCETGTKCMPDGSCCPNDNYCESSENGTECCTSDGVAGLCLNNSCQTKTCDAGEKLYIFDDYEDVGSELLVGCCVNNPTTDYFYQYHNGTIGYEGGFLCCPIEKPVYHICAVLGEGSEYCCFEKTPKCIEGYGDENGDGEPDECWRFNYCSKGYSTWDISEGIWFNRECA